jgi:hypothetical protein
MLGDGGLQLGDELAVASEAQVGLDALLEGGQPQLLESADLALRKILVGHVGERRPSPEFERGAQGLGCGGRVGCELGSPLLDEALEPERIDRVGLHAERVAARPRLHQLPAEGAAKLRDVHLERVPGRLGRLLPPQLLD